MSLVLTEFEHRVDGPWLDEVILQFKDIESASAAKVLSVPLKRLHPQVLHSLVQHFRRTEMQPVEFMITGFFGALVAPGGQPTITVALARCHPSSPEDLKAKHPMQQVWIDQIRAILDAG